MEEITFTVVNFSQSTKQVRSSVVIDSRTPTVFYEPTKSLNTVSLRYVMAC